MKPEHDYNTPVEPGAQSSGQPPDGMPGYTVPAAETPPGPLAAEGYTAGEDGPAKPQKPPKPPRPRLSPEEKAARARRRRRALRRAVPTLVITLVYLVLVYAMFATARQASLTPSALSLRFTQPLSAAQVANAKHYWANPDLSPSFYAAYWREVPSDSISTGRGSANTPVLYVDGDMSAVLPVNFIQGGYPSAIEDRGLALSEGLAWQLFGGTMVTGSTITWKGNDYTVRGVFEGDELQLLAQIDAKNGDIDSFTAVELCGSPETEVREAAKSYLQKAGLPEADVVLGAQTLPNLLWALAWLPAIILIVWFVARLFMLLHHTSFWKRQLTWLVLLFAAAFILPQLLADLPGWVIPKQWSDFEHWVEFIKEMNARVTQWMSITPGQRDIQLRRQLILQVVLLVPALFALVSTIRRWAAHMRRKEIGLRVALAYQQGLDPAHFLGEEMAEELGVDTDDAPEEGYEPDDYDDILALKSERDVKKNPVS